MNARFCVELVMVALLACERSAHADPDTLKFTLDANEKTSTFERREHDDWIVVCKAPCTDVALRGVFRVAGTDLVPTNPFRIDTPYAVKIHASMASTATHKAGIAMMIAGSVMGVLSAVLTLVGAFNLRLTSDNISCTPPCPQPFDGGPLFGAGLVLMSIAVLPSTFGVVLFAQTSKVTVTF